MRIFFTLFILLVISSSANSENNYFQDEYFYIGKMDSYNKDFTLYFKTRQKSVLAKGENYNYITDYPQDLYIYNNKTKTEKPLISYEWFPSSAKQILRNYNFPVFPEDFAYYLLSDNNTLIMVSAMKNVNKAAETKDAKIGDIFKNAQSVVDNMANKGVIHKNKAARIKSRLNKKVKSA